MTALLCIGAVATWGQRKQRRLEQAGYRVDLAESAIEGFALLKAHRYDLILLNGSLGDREVLAVLRELIGPGNAPVVIMVTPDHLAIAIDALELGAAHYIVQDEAGRYLELLPAVVECVLSRQRLIAERQQAQELAQITLQSIGDAVIATDADGKVRSINPVAARLTGWTPEAAEGQPVDTVFRIVHEQTGAALSSPIHDALRDGKVSHCSNQSMLLTRAGQRLPVSDSAAPIHDGDGQVVGAVLVFQDASERRAYERNLSLFEKVFQHTSEPIIITKPNGAIIDVNDAFCRISGYRRSEVLGQTPALMRSGRHAPDFYSRMWSELRATGHWEGEIWDRRKSGEVYPKWLVINAVRDPFGKTTHFVGIFTDITSLKEAEDRLHQLAHYDVLTGLPNRTLFQDRLQRAIYHATRAGRQVALMFLDLDHFKHINDRLGHPAGDDLLTQVAERLTSQVRESDTVARVGGDEFTVILTDLNCEEDATQVAGKILDAFSRPFTVAGEAIVSSPSIGIALFPDAGRDLAGLIKAADAAMYEAKQKGRNHFVVAAGRTRRERSDTARLADDLKRAIAKGELVPFYQPQVGARCGRMRGMELLLRWRHPRQGLLLPCRFLPFAEQADMVDTIGAWVLRSACQQSREWNRGRREPLRIGVNIATRQLMGEAFIEQVAGALTETGADPSSLVLEISAQETLNDLPAATARLHRLKSLGLQIALDRFGNGHTSLVGLKRLPIDVLKVDRTFIRNIHLDGDDTAVSRAVIGLARSLRLRVVAVGVETGEQAAILQRERCCDLQGFYFGHPVSSEEAGRLLAVGDSSAPVPPAAG